MKKLFLILSIILVGCVDGHMSSLSHVSKERNKKCADIKEVKVFQVFEDGALASVCENSYSTYCSGMTVVVLRERGEDLWDDKRVKASKDKCFVYDGTYKYESKGAGNKTVPILRFDYEYNATTEEEAFERLEEMREYIYDECLDELNRNFKNEKDKNIKKCECVVDFTIDKLIALNKDNSEQSKLTEKFLKEATTQMEKKCGKLPKSMKL